MRTSAILTSTLLILLIGSNIFWLNAYRQQEAPKETPPPVSCAATQDEIFREVAAPLARAITAAALPGASKESILLAADGGTQRPQNAPSCINEEGANKVRGVALFFNAEGKLTNATTGVCIP